MDHKRYMRAHLFALKDGKREARAKSHLSKCRGHHLTRFAILLLFVIGFLLLLFRPQFTVMSISDAQQNARLGSAHRGWVNGYLSLLELLGHISEILHVHHALLIAAQDLFLNVSMVRSNESRVGKENERLDDAPRLRKWRHTEFHLDWLKWKHLHPHSCQDEKQTGSSMRNKPRNSKGVEPSHTEPRRGAVMQVVLVGNGVDCDWPEGGFPGSKISLETTVLAVGNILVAQSNWHDVRGPKVVHSSEFQLVVTHVPSDHQHQQQESKGINKKQQEAATTSHIMVEASQIVTKTKVSYIKQYGQLTK
jgi:hypothetical protein